MRGFQRLCDPDGYGNGTWARQISDTEYHIIEVTDMDDACGRDNEGCPKYVVELSAIDLDKMSVDIIRHAKQFTGIDSDPDLANNPLAIVEACHSYGAKAPLHSVSTGSRSKGFAECRAESYSLTRDSALMEARMQRPVNKLGATAEEYMTGSMMPIVRAIDSGSMEGQILAKMYGIKKD